MKSFIIAVLLVTFAASINLSFAAAAKQFFPTSSDGLVPLTGGSFKAVKYWISTFSLNAANADYYCQKSGKRLLSIQTEDKERELEQMLEAEKVQESPWTSGTDLTRDGEWLWGTGERILFNRFIRSDTDRPAANCLRIHSVDNEFHWDKEDCSDKNYFICEA